MYDSTPVNVKKTGDYDAVINRRLSTETTTGFLQQLE